MLRAAVIGLGVGEQHIAGYLSHPGCEVAALCDRDPGKLAEVAARHPNIPATTRAEDVLDDPSIDIVSIATWDDAHAEQVLRAIRAGKHVFCEKPLCLHESELLDIRRALEARREVRLSSNLLLRACPRFAALRELVARGGLGRLYSLEADYNYGRLQKITEGWRGAIPFYSVFLGGAMHMVDLLIWLTGWKVAEVTARGNNIATVGTGFRFNDFCVALLTFENGAVAKVAANFACVAPHFHRLLLHGTEATFENFPEHGRITRSRQPGGPCELMEQDYPGYAKGDLLADFVGRILAGAGPEGGLAPSEDIFTAMSICLAVERSMQTGASVPVRYC